MYYTFYISNAIVLFSIVQKYFIKLFGMQYEYDSITYPQQRWLDAQSLAATRAKRISRTSQIGPFSESTSLFATRLSGEDSK